MLRWDGRSPGVWMAALEGAEAVINFTGRSINCRLTRANRRLILNSRLDSIRLLGDAIGRCAQPPRCFIQCGAIGFYGDSASPCTEESPAGAGFLAEVCSAVESAFFAATQPPTRHVLLRIGIVLGREGGALPALTRLVRGYLGGAAGNGRQVISWIHIGDLTRLFTEAIRDESLDGAINATSPNPVSNAVFMRHLRELHGRPWAPPAPAMLLRPLCFIGGMNPDLVLGGQPVLPRRLQQHGFAFRFPDLGAALRDLHPWHAEQSVFGPK